MSSPTINSYLIGSNYTIFIGNLKGTETVEKAGNISWSDRVSAYVFYLKGLNKLTSISTLLKCRGLYRNYITVSMHILTKKYPFEASLRNGVKLLLP